MDHLHGTLDMLILQILLHGPLHGYGIAKELRTTSGVLKVEFGSLYPALQRMEHRGWISADNSRADHQRAAKFYTITAAGKRHLGHERAKWEAFVGAVTLAMSTFSTR